MDDSIQLQEEEVSLDSIETLPPVTMEVPSTPVSCNNVYYIMLKSCDLILWSSSRVQNLEVGYGSYVLYRSYIYSKFNIYCHGYTAFSQFAEHMSDSDMSIVMKGVTYLPKKRYMIYFGLTKYAPEKN